MNISAATACCTTSATSAGDGPDVGEEDRLALGVGAERLGVQVDVHRAGQRVGDDERRGREVVHLHVRVDPALEVPVAGQHGDDGEVVVVDRLADRRRQRPGVADAGGAAVADEVEAELVQVRDQAGPLVVVHDDLRAGREAGLHPGLAVQALLDRLLGQQRGADHHERVGGVRAGGDRGDHDVAVVERRLGAVLQGDPDLVGRPVVVAGRSGRRRGTCRSAGRRGCRTAARRGTRSWRWPARSCPAGASGPAMLGTTVDRSRVSSSENRSSRAGSCHRPCALAYVSTRSIWLAGRPVSVRYSMRRRRRSGRSRRSSRTPATCCRSSPGSPPGPGRRRRRGTRRTCRRRRACAASR